MELILAIVTAITQAIPRIVALVRSGRDFGEIKFSQVVAADALADVRAANARVDDYIDHG